jgi:hypothetical protein
MLKGSLKKMEVWRSATFSAVVARQDPEVAGLA